MSAVMICSDSTRSPEMRHEVPVAVPDAFLYVEQNGRRVAVVSSLEAERIRAADPGIGVIPLDVLGWDDLLADGIPYPGTRPRTGRSCSCGRASTGAT